MAKTTRSNAEKEAAPIDLESESTMAEQSTQPTTSMQIKEYTLAQLESLIEAQVKQAINNIAQASPMPNPGITGAADQDDLATRAEQASRAAIGGPNLGGIALTTSGTPVEYGTGFTTTGTLDHDARQRLLKQDRSLPTLPETVLGKLRDNQFVDLKIIYKAILLSEGVLSSNEHKEGSGTLIFESEGKVKFNDANTGARIPSTKDFLYALTILCTYWAKLQKHDTILVGEIWSYLARFHALARSDQATPQNLLALDHQQRTRVCNTINASGIKHYLSDIVDLQLPQKHWDPRDPDRGRGKRPRSRSPPGSGHPPICRNYNHGRCNDNKCKRRHECFECGKRDCIKEGKKSCTK